MSEQTELHPAQQAYIRIRKQASRISPDPVLSDLLGFGLLWTEIDTLSEGEFGVICALLKAGDETTLKNVYLPSGLLSKRGLVRKLHAQGLEQPLVHDVKRNIKLCSAIERCLHSCTTLTNLDLFSMKITKEGARHLSKGLKVSKSLLHLSLKGSRCGDDIFPAIAHGISHCHSLQEACLSDCALSDVSGGRICDMIRIHCSRRNDARWTSSLRGVANKVRDIDSEIARAGLLVLDLSDNQLSSKSAASLARVLENDTWIGALNLSNNKLSSKGIRYLLDTLEGSNEWLSVLDLRGNCAEALIEQVDDLLRARAFNKTLQLVNKESEKIIGADPAVVIASAATSWRCGHQLTSDTAEIVANLVSQSEERLDVNSLNEMAKVLRGKLACKRRGVRVKAKPPNPQALSKAQALSTTEDRESALALVEQSIEQLQSYVSHMDEKSPSPTAPSEGDVSGAEEVVMRLRKIIDTAPE